MKKLIVGAICILFLVTGCAGTDKRYSGAALGGALGGTIGALALQSNSWLGLAIGATAGTLGGWMIGTSLEDEARRSQTAAVNSGERVVYYNDRQQAVDSTPVGQRYYYADQAGNPTRTNCQKVRTKVWEGDRVVSDKTEEVCTGNKTTQTY